MSHRTMTILGKSIPLGNDYLNINDLLFLRDNPRVYACTHGVSDFENKPQEKQQEIIYEKLQSEPSVKNLIPEIKRHGGLIEPILVRTDTKEVIEGNSRLAVYRKLHLQKAKGEWELIPCNLVSGLTEEQQAAFLNQIHVKGKTSWSAYEKANFSYVRLEKGMKFLQIAKLFGESDTTIRRRCKAIEMMKENNDGVRSHFSYYEVLTSSKMKEVRENTELVKNLLHRVRKFSPEDEEGNAEPIENGDSSEFTAKDLRDKLPSITRKRKVLKQFLDGTIGFDEAYQRAKTSDVEGKIKKATGLLSDIEPREVQMLNGKEMKACKYAFKKLKRIGKDVGKLINEDCQE